MAPFTAERDVLETIRRERETAQTHPAVVCRTSVTESYCTIRVNVYSGLSSVVIRGEDERARRPTSFRERSDVLTPTRPILYLHESSQGH